MTSSATGQQPGDSGPGEAQPWGERTLWQEDIDSDKPGGPAYQDHCRVQVMDASEANLVGSVVPAPFRYDALAGQDTTELHMPVIDIDVPCKLIESTTPGHFHLYIDRTVTWEQYCGLLRAMVDCGYVEEGYYQAALRRGATFVRKPGVLKPQRPARDWSRQY